MSKTIGEKLNDGNAALSALLIYANGVTGAADANIGDAVKTLADGFGGGGSSGSWGGQLRTDPQYIYHYMLHCMATGNAVSGQIDSVAMPNTETLLLDTGLSELHGFCFLFNDYPISGQAGGTQNMLFGIITINADDTFNIMSYLNTGNATKPGSGIENSSNIMQSANMTQGNAYSSYPVNGSIRFDGGRVYYTARYNKNASYQLLKVGLYDWIAW